MYFCIPLNRTPSS